MSTPLTADELSKEILALGAEIETRLQNMQALCINLTKTIKIAESDDNTNVYLRFSSVWGRYANMSLHALSRSNGVGKLLNRTVARNLEEQQAALEARSKLKSKPIVNKTSPIEALLSMYSNAQEDEDREPYRTRKPDSPRK